MSTYDITTDNAFGVESSPVNQTSLETVESRLEGAGIGSERFITVEYNKGSKKPVETGWQKNQYSAESIDGPAGITCGNGLVVVDLDDHKAGVESPEEVGDLPDTFTVGSMHGGTHLYFKVTGEQRSRSRSWGDIQSSKSMVVSPGAEFSHSECNDCGQQGVGQYTILQDNPIAAVDPEDFPRIFGIQANITPEEGTSGDKNPTFKAVDVDSRLTFAVEHDEKFSSLWNWGKSGRSTSDNSTRETALAQKLMFYLGWDEKKVRRVLNGLNLPKWENRGESYRESVISAAREWTKGAGEKFDPEKSSSGTGGVTRLTALNVVSGVFDAGFSHPAGQFKTAEVAESDDVDVSERHIRKVLEALEDDGHIHYKRDGRSGYWIIDGIDNGGSSLPAHGEFYHQFTTKAAVKQQRAAFLDRKSEDI